MIDTEMQLYKELFLQSDFYKIVDDTDVKYGYSALGRALEQKATEIIELCPDLARAYNTISVIYSFVLVPDSNGEPYKPFWIMNGKRSLIPEDLTNEQLSFLDEIKDEIEEPFLRARIADVLWVLKFPKKDVDNVRKAIDTYIEFELNPKTIYRKRKQLWLRAIHFSKSIRDFDRQDIIRTSLLEYLEKAPLDESLFSLHLSEIMLEMYYLDSDMEKIVSILGKFINDSKKRYDWDAVQRYGSTTILWYQRLKREEDESRVKVEVAESYVSQAEAQREYNCLGSA